jgi:membrane protein YqaA with SNARE-associated domain
VKLTSDITRRLALRVVPKSSSHLLRWIVGLGGIGLFIVAVIDSSMIPLPIPGSTDLLLLVLSAHPYTSALLAVSFVAWAVAGSIVGGYLTWRTGQKGGEVALERYNRGRFLRPIAAWVKRHGALSVGVAALLPPPIPLLPFLLAAGALGIPRNQFLFSYSAARIARYSLIGWLGFTYGRHFVKVFQRTLAGWTTPVLSIYIGLVALGAGYGLWKFLKQRRKPVKASLNRSPLKST